MFLSLCVFFFFQAEDGIRDFCLSRGLGDVYKRQVMARKKNTEAPVTEEVKTQDPTVTSETPVISNEESEKQEQDTVETPDTSSIKESSQKPEKKDKTKEKDEIPEFVKELLQKYPGYPALYIDSKGGVFTADAQPNWVKDAILYQNPYYKQ